MSVHWKHVRVEDPSRRTIEAIMTKISAGSDGSLEALGGFKGFCPLLKSMARGRRIHVELAALLIPRC